MSDVRSQVVALEAPGVETRGTDAPTTPAARPEPILPMLPSPVTPCASPPAIPAIPPAGPPQGTAATSAGEAAEPEDPSRAAGEPLVMSGEAPLHPRLTGRIKGVRGLRRPEEILPAGVNAEQRLLILDTWRRSGLPSGDFSFPIIPARRSRNPIGQWRRAETQNPKSKAEDNS
jgi:hypothetical protein